MELIINGKIVTLEMIQNIVLIFAGVIGLIFTIFFQFRSKKSESDSKLASSQADLIQTYEAQLKLLRSQADEDKAKILEWNKRYSEQQGIIAEKEKSISLLTQIAQNRNPQLEAYIQEGLEVNKQILTYLKSVSSTTTINNNLPAPATN